MSMILMLNAERMLAEGKGEDEGNALIAHLSI